MAFDIFMNTEFARLRNEEWDLSTYPENGFIADKKARV